MPDPLTGSFARVVEDAARRPASAQRAVNLIGAIAPLALVWVALLSASACSDDPVPEAGPQEELRPDLSGPVLITDTVPSCPECEIDLTLDVTLGSAADPVLLIDPPTVGGRSGAGYYATVPTIAGHEVIAYDASGRYRGTFSRKGEGPGEFQNAWQVHTTPEDTLYLLHDFRVSVFAPDESFVRTATLEFPGRQQHLTRIVTATPERFLLRGGVVREEAQPFPFHWYDQTGAYESGFGAVHLGDPERLRNGRRPVEARVATITASGNVWAASHDNYRLEEYTPAGDTLRILGIVPPGSWYGQAHMSSASYEAALNDPPPSVPIPTPPQGEEDEGTIMPRSPPKMSIGGLYPVSDSTMLVLAHVAREDWYQARGERSTRYTAEREVLPGYADELYETAIDLVDYRTATVLARSRVPGRLYVSSDQLIYRPRILESGLIVVDILTPTVRAH